MNASSLVQKFWNFCNTLRDDGLGYGDYLEQLTFLLFLKLANEYSRPPHNRTIPVPAGWDWPTLTSKNFENIEAYYLDLLQKLGKEPGTLGAIFFRAQNKIQDPAKLLRLVQMIDAEEWASLDADTKGDLYEGLLQKNAEDAKSGAGQYFTPRPVIRAIMECVQPQAMKTIADPACGTGGFFLAAHAWLSAKKLNTDERDFLREKTFFGNEIVPGTRRLCLMNLFLHNIGDLNGNPPIEEGDALLKVTSEKYDYVFANPPFGKKSAITITNDDGDDDRDSLTYQRPDFWEKTSNKQLNFLQHIVSMLKRGGEAAVVLPDNVLFEAGVGERVRRRFLHTCNVHTILRLPAGIFYAQGVKASVVFFDRPLKDFTEAATSGIWFYDLRTNKRFTRKTKLLQYEDLVEFIECYKDGRNSTRKESERFKYYSYAELQQSQSMNLDVKWIDEFAPDKVDDLPSPDILAQEIVSHLEEALVSFREMASKFPRTDSDC